MITSSATDRVVYLACLAMLANFALLLPGNARAEVRVYKLEIGLPNTVAVMVRGMYDGNEILRLKSAIAEIDPGKRVVAILESPGGSVTQGEALGRFFFDAKIPTIVLAGTVCASACTYAFLGGRDPTSGNPLRILVSGAKLGFHNFGVPGGLPEKNYTKTDLENISRETQQIVFKNLLHLMYVNAPLRVLKLNTGTKFEEVNWITEGEALDYGIAVLNRENGRLVLPDNLEKRIRKVQP